MPSSYFTLSPSSGSGNATASVTATTVNTGTTDNNATITITNGAKTRTVSAKQLYKPYFVQGSNQIPASGGTLTFVVHTEYDIAFIYSAGWYSVMQNGTTVPTRTVIASSNASGATFTIQVNENTATNARSASFPMVHYIRGNMVVSGYLTIDQEAASGGRIALALNPGSLVLDYMAGQSGTTTVSLSGLTSANVSASDTTNFNINPTGSVGNNTVITVRTNSENIYHGDRTSIIQLQSTLGTNTTTCTATQRYKPYLVQNGTSLPSSGGRVTFTAYTEYDIFFSNIPSWATVTFNGSAITSGQRLSSYAASGATFTIIVEENTESERSASNFSMGCYVGETPVSGVQNITLTQSGGQATVYATSVTINISSVIYESGNTTVTVGPTGANTDITYTSSDPSIATIDSGGTITVLQDGIVTICAYDNISQLGDCKTVQVYEESPGPDTGYSSQYLTFVIIGTGSGNILLRETGVTRTVEYSKNNGGWTPVTTVVNDAVSIPVNYGDEVRFRGNNPNYKGFSFDATIRFNLYGNVMSLINSSNFSDLTTLPTDEVFNRLFKDCQMIIDASNLVLPATATTESCYWGMFSGCTSLTTAPVLLPATTLSDYCYSSMFADCRSLNNAPVLPATTLAYYCYSSMFARCVSITTTPVLPATTLASNCYSNMFQGCISLTTSPVLPATTLMQGCYSYMFYSCTGLTTAPALPVTTLARSCYAGMFRDCASLITAPELPATALTEYCYSNMFYNCESLTTAPALPAATLAEGCYHQMFYGCTNLNYIKCLATDISATSCTNNWVSSVAANGTFVKNSAMSSWTTGNNGIPSGWTVQDAT